MKTEADEVEVKVRIIQQDFRDMVHHFAHRAKGRPLIGVLEYEKPKGWCENCGHIHHETRDHCESCGWPQIPDGTDER